MALGSSAYSLILQRKSDNEAGEKGGKPPSGVGVWVGTGIFLMSGTSFLLTYAVARFELGVLALVSFEVTCGLYFPMISTLRSEWIPERSRAAVMSLFRLPVNVVVVVVLVWSSQWPSQQVFLVLAGCQFAAALAYLAFVALPEDSTDDKGYFPNVASFLSTTAVTAGKALPGKASSTPCRVIAPSPTPSDGVRRSPRLRKAPTAYRPVE